MFRDVRVSFTLPMTSKRAGSEGNKGERVLV